MMLFISVPDWSSCGQIDVCFFFLFSPSSFSAVFSFPAVHNEESLIGVSKPLPRQLWEAKKVSE